MTTKLHQTTSGRWVPCSATQRACPRKSHVEVSGDQHAAVDFMNSVPAKAASEAAPTMHLSAATIKVLDTLEAAGLAPYIVGGSVRDAVLGGTVPKDVDIEVYGGEVSEVAGALRKLGRVDEVGKSFGVLKLTLAGEDFDVSLPRRDSKTGAGHRDFAVEVDPNLSLREASARRDYTINALMYSHREQRVIDLHGGLADLKTGYLRHVSEAFDEDPLRVLRGVQLAARFDMRLHPSTVAKAATLRTKYHTLAIERVQMEFQKLYDKGKNLPRATQALRETGWDHLFPGLAQADAAVLDARLRRAQELSRAGDIPASKRTLLLAATIASTLDPASRGEFLRYTAVDNDTRLAAKALTELPAPRPDGASVRQWACDLPRHLTVRDWCTYQRVLNEPAGEKVYAAAQAAGVLDAAEPDIVTGYDLLALFPGRKAGPWCRVALAKARAAQYGEAFSDSEGGRAWLAQHAAELG